MKVGIIGAGTMGRGIAQVAASAQCETVLYDSFEEAISSSAASHEKIFNRLIEKGRMDEAQKDAIQSRLVYTSELEAIKNCDLVIEAIIEDIDIKKQVFQRIEELVSDDCIIASNTSSLSITSLAASLNKPERFIGIHFFNPAPLMKLVEIVPAIQTADSVQNQIKDLIDGWGKVTVKVKDTPGFIVNKVARPFYSEALRIYEEGIADFATIDEAMRSVGGFRMGPFELMDFIGNDVNYAVTESVWTAFYYDPRYKPAFTQKRLSEAGYLGRKSGRGYYDYSEGSQKPDASSDSQLQEYVANRIVMMLINEAADTLHTGIASLEDIDLAMTKGVNYPKGLLRWADEIGIDTVVNSIDVLYNDYHEDRYRCSPILRMKARDGQTFYQNT